MTEMKKIIQNITGLAAAAVSALFLLNSCALTMEDWVATDENKGYGETQKEEYDGLTVEYKYKDDTRSLTDKIQGYLVSFDEVDSILHFLDNLPDEYLPKVGGCVVANCCQQFPSGLVARVQSVDHSNGMYNIALSDADIKDAYDEFEYDLKTDIVLSSDSTSSNVKQRNVRRMAADGKYESEDVVTDWTLFNRMVNGTNKTQTRAGDSSTEGQGTSTKDDYETDINGDKVGDEDIDWDAITTTSSTFFEINNFTGWQSPFVNCILNSKTPLNDFYIKVSSLNKTRIEKHVSLSQDMEYQKTIQANGASVKFSVGFDVGNYGAKDDLNNSLTALKDFCNFKKGTALKDAFKNWSEHEAVNDKTKKGIAFEIPLPGIPIPAVIKITPQVDFSLGIYGGDSISYWTGAEIIETKMQGGKKIKEKKTPLESKPENHFPFYIGGKFVLGGSFETFIGVGKKVGPRDVIGVGAYASVGIDLKGAYDYMWDSFNGYEIAATGNGASLDPVLAVGAKAYVGSFANFNFGAPYKFDLPSIVKFPHHPTFAVDDVIMKFYQNETGYSRTLDCSYSVKSLGALGGFGGLKKNHWVPWLLVYRVGHEADEAPIAALSDEDNSVGLKLNKTYKFQFATNDVISEYDLVPAIKAKGDFDPNNPSRWFTIYPDYKLYVPPYLKPKIKYQIDDDGNILYQTFGGRKFTVTGTDFNYYFTIPFELKNAGMIENYWDDWGVRVRVWISHDGTNYNVATEKSQYLSLKGKVVKTGSYQPVIKFTYSIQGKVEKEPYFMVESCLYYIDKDDKEEKEKDLASSSLNIHASDYLTQDVTYNKSYYETQSLCQLVNLYYKMENHKTQGPSWFENKKSNIKQIPLTVTGVKDY